VISIVVPVYNSEKTIEKLCEKIIINMNSHNFDYEIILVDDNSRDKSYNLMKQLHNNYNNITCIKLRENAGQQNALLCGLRYGLGNYFVTIDDDLQYNPDDIIELYIKMQEGYDVVYGVPSRKQHNKYRNSGTYIKEWMFSVMLGKPRAIRLTSYRIMTKNIVNQIKLETASYVYLSATILKYTKNIANVEINHYDRQFGKSNYNFKKLLKLFVNIIIYYSHSKLFNGYQKDVPQYIVEEVLISKTTHLEK
jgi:undecaprenyl-phosphate 4-deoxy-4-formamido-L-arabinose transferase